MTLDFISRLPPLPRLSLAWSPNLLITWLVFLVTSGNGNPLQYSCLENPRDRGAWWAAVYGVAQSRTRLKRLSSSSAVLSHAKMIQGAAQQQRHFCHWGNSKDLISLPE